MRELKSLYRIAKAARLYDIVPVTLYTAVMRGDVQHETTACGLPLVRLEDVEAFLASPPRRGRPKTPLNEGEET